MSGDKCQGAFRMIAVCYDWLAQTLGKIFSQPTELALTSCLIIFLFCLRTYVANSPPRHSFIEAATHVPLDTAFAALTLLAGFASHLHDWPANVVIQLIIYFCFLLFIRHCQRKSEKYLGAGAYAQLGVCVTAGFFLGLILFLWSILRINGG